MPDFEFEFEFQVRTVVVEILKEIKGQGPLKITEKEVSLKESTNHIYLDVLGDQLSPKRTWG